MSGLFPTLPKPWISDSCWQLTRYISGTFFEWIDNLSMDVQWYTIKECKVEGRSEIDRRSAQWYRHNTCSSGSLSMPLGRLLSLFLVKFNSWSEDNPPRSVPSDRPQ
jgi:hypothetical protein